MPPAHAPVRTAPSPALDLAAAASPSPELAASHILIVDDDPSNTAALERLFRKFGYTDVIVSTDPHKVLELCGTHSPDIILLDYNMPGLNGIDVLDRLRDFTACSHVPIVMLTADSSADTKQRALLAGASDFLSKPFEMIEVLLRIRNQLQVRSLHVHMEERVAERTMELAEAHQEMLDRLAQAAEFRDDETGQHTRRVGEVAEMIAEGLGFSPERVHLMRQGAPLHDVGKIGIPDSILLKPGPLTASEIRVMRTHTTIGARLLSKGKSEVFGVAETIALTHHERWDGHGYPRGLAGDAIPIEGRIVALADFYDALTHDRRYRKAWTEEETLAEIASESGSHFDPEVVDAFTRSVAGA